MKMTPVAGFGCQGLPFSASYGNKELLCFTRQFAFLKFPQASKSPGEG